MTEFLKQLAIGIVVGVVLAVGAWGRLQARAWLDRRNPSLRPLTLGAFAILWLAAIALATTVLEWPAMLIVVIAVLAIGLLTVWYELSEFWAVGIHGADQQTRRGVDYKRALRLCQNELDFLGTGAAKLTGERTEFEAAVHRCNRPDRPMRFLLLHPQSAHLVLDDAARQAGSEANEYRRRVSESFRVISGLRRNQAMNLEVRFYRDRVPFRLMFIDDSICLASYNAYGEGDGSQLPQLHLVKQARRRDVNSFYYPFRMYFERLWQASETWDFEQWI